MKSDTIVSYEVNEAFLNMLGYDRTILNSQGKEWYKLLSTVTIDDYVSYYTKR